ncbi:E3 ubiquitin-protein ligase MYLIP-like [Ruditapes philippinarum]|uniref:E3 ubiquitin-protein ligase MYLIP-like n=1 Tax=Ruditapes philippinarum TaxID=129788 RepID=UPI00295AAA73|nr:E3 ubiquitin-protein ligase MYLIP-like [Ruditapes philippinarum]
MEGYNIFILVLCVSAFNGYSCESKINDFVASAFESETLFCTKHTEMKGVPCMVPNDMDEGSSINTPNRKLTLVSMSVSMVLVVCGMLVYIRIRRRRILTSKHDYGHEDIDRPADLVQTNIKEPDPSTDSVNLTDSQTPETTRGLLGSEETSEKQKERSMTSASQVETNAKVLDDIQERIMCKICLTRKMNVVFSPCNHMVACAGCSDLLDRCAVCRTPIKGTFVVYTEF